MPKMLKIMRLKTKGIQEARRKRCERLFTPRVRERIPVDTFTREPAVQGSAEALGLLIA